MILEKWNVNMEDTKKQLRKGAQIDYATAH